MNRISKIAVIGGTGMVGKRIASKALEKGYQVRMLVRNPKKVILKDAKLEIVKGDVRNRKEIQTLLKDCDVVINTFGQPMKGKQIYSNVTETILSVMDDLQIDRYIGVTGGSLTITGDKKGFINRVGAKMFEVLYSDMMKEKKKEWELLNENRLMKWTLIRLPFIADKQETGRVKENLTDMPGTKITNGDIAAFIMGQIKSSKYIHKAPFISN